MTDTERFKVGKAVSNYGVCWPTQQSRERSGGLTPHIRSIHYCPLPLSPPQISHLPHPSFEPHALMPSLAIRSSLLQSLLSPPLLHYPRLHSSHSNSSGLSFSSMEPSLCCSLCSQLHLSPTTTPRHHPLSVCLLS